jgi:hypothetical protein
VRRWIAIGGAAVVLAAVLVVIGVGGGSSTPTVPSSTVAQAATAMTKLRGYRVAISGVIHIPNQSGDVTMKGTGVIGRAGKQAALNLTMAGLPGLPSGGMKMEEVMSDFVMYMRTPLFEGKLPDGKAWMKMDLAKATQQFGVDVSQVSSDPSRSLDQLRTVSGRVERLGQERVRGVRTTHYRATVDMRRYVNLVPPARRAQARKGIERLVSMIGKSKFPEEVWIDAQRHIRRIAFDLSFRLPTVPGNPEASMKMDEQLYDFGTKAAITVPSDDEVFDATKLAQHAAQSALPGQ